MEFNVANIKPIVWNDEAFQGLVLAADRKNLLRSLVDAHNADLGFDDFIQGKGIVLSTSFGKSASSSLHRST